MFPGIALGVIATGTHHIPEDMFLIASQIIGITLKFKKKTYIFEHEDVFGAHYNSITKSGVISKFL